MIFTAEYYFKGSVSHSYYFLFFTFHFFLKPLQAGFLNSTKIDFTKVISSEYFSVLTLFGISASADTPRTWFLQHHFLVMILWCGFWAFSVPVLCMPWYVGISYSWLCFFWLLLVYFHLSLHTLSAWTQQALGLFTTLSLIFLNPYFPTLSLSSSPTHPLEQVHQTHSAGTSNSPYPKENFLFPFSPLQLFFLSILPENTWLLLLQLHPRLQSNPLTYRSWVTHVLLPFLEFSI